MKHPMISTLAALAAACVLASPSSAEPARPLLDGTFTLTRARSAAGQEIDLAKAKVSRDQVWLRMAFTFQGRQLTVSTALLEHDAKRGYVACEASATVDVTWGAHGFILPATVQATSRVTLFSKLTARGGHSDSEYCTAKLDGGVFVVEPGAAPALHQNGNTFFLAPTTETDIDWSRHVPE